VRYLSCPPAHTSGIRKRRLFSRCPEPVTDGVADGALLVAGVRLHDRCQAAELSPDHLPASGRRAGRLAGKISNAGQDACDHLMVFSQLPHGVPKIGPDPQQLSEQVGVLTVVMCRQCRAEGQTVRYQPPGLRRAKICPQAAQLLPNSCMRLSELTAPCHRAAGLSSGHQNVIPFGPAPPCLALSATSTRYGTHRIKQRLGSQTSSPPSPPPIDVA